MPLVDDWSTAQLILLPLSSIPDEVNERMDD